MGTDFRLVLELSCSALLRDLPSVSNRIPVKLQWFEQGCDVMSALMPRESTANSDRRIRWLIYRTRHDGKSCTAM